jgi:hypothetical protein
VITVTIRKRKHWIAKCEQDEFATVGRTNRQVREVIEAHFRDKHPGQSIHYEVK